jgi:hypothetical protein
MRKIVMTVLVSALFASLFWGGAGAQIVPENHYLVYDVQNVYTVTAEIRLMDQFNEFQTNFIEFDKFANPVEKNGEPILDPNVHQTWWLIDDPVPPGEDRLVGLVNQFGRQDWVVGDGRYLVLPAHKNMPGWPEPWNHYKCYEADGPPVDVPVQLADQFGFYDMTAVEPVLFCNPCIKEVFGQWYEILWPEAHLAVYRLEPPTGVAGFAAVASDQFGEWEMNFEEPVWLVLPTDKLTVVMTETSTWGRVKSLFR